MSTKAESFKAQKQRAANPPRPKQPKRPRRDLDVDTSLPGVSATDRRVGAGSTATRNASKRAEKKGGAVLEDSATGKPSRKSTRKSTGGLKRTTALQQRATSKKVTSPSARAAKASAKPKKVARRAKA